jgi:DNA-binding NarL/FixJ family response regulator
LLRDAVSGRSYIDPEIEARVQQVRHKDENDPLALLEPNERSVATLLAQGLTNGQIAARLGLRDRRAVSRTNGQIYAAWGLNDTATDEKVARTRATIIVREGKLVVWDANGVARTMGKQGDWIRWDSSDAEEER